MSAETELCNHPDTYNHCVKVYNNDLSLQFILGEEGSGDHQSQNPRGLCTGPDGKLYVCDGMNHRIKVYSRYLQLVRTFGSKGTGEQEYDQPTGLSFTPSGLLVVTEAVNKRVKVVNPDGSFVRHIGCSGPGQFSGYPVSVATGKDGAILVNEQLASNIKVFSITGDYLRTITPIVRDSSAVIKI